MKSELIIKIQTEYIPTNWEEPSSSSDLHRMTTLLIEGLNTDGAHHKQYFLEEVLREMVPEKFKDYKASWQWENGIIP